MDLNAYEASDDDDAIIFGKERYLVHFRILDAIYKAKVDALLPILYYACSSNDVSYILTRFHTMDAECLHALLNGKARLEFATNTVIGKLPDLLHDAVAECPAGCSNKAHLCCLSDFLGTTKIRRLRGRFVIWWCVKDACDVCEKKIEVELNKRRNEIWEKVPSYFGLPGWDQARQQFADFS